MNINGLVERITILIYTAVKFILNNKVEIELSINKSYNKILILMFYIKLINSKIVFIFTKM